ncbi:TPA: ester cyclase [Pseudomonas aeruginosa]|nr:ester cyclase [Pseudomonas aeruginosa]
MLKSDNAQIVLDSIEVIWNRGEFDRIPEFYTEDFVSHQGGYSLWKLTWDPGRDGLHRFVSKLREEFPDYHESPEVVFSEQDFVIVRQTISGTTRGTGVFPTSNQKMSVKDMMICRLKDRKLHEQWGLTDFYSMAIQLGLLEPI